MTQVPARLRKQPPRPKANREKGNADDTVLFNENWRLSFVPLTSQSGFSVKLELPSLDKHHEAKLEKDLWDVLQPFKLSDLGLDAAISLPTSLKFPSLHYATAFVENDPAVIASLLRYAAEKEHKRQGFGIAVHMGPPGLETPGARDQFDDLLSQCIGEAQIGKLVKTGSPDPESLAAVKAIHAHCEANKPARHLR